MAGVKITQSQFTAISEKLDEVILLSNQGILGNSRQRILDAKLCAQEAKKILYEGILEPDGNDAA